MKVNAYHPQAHNAIVYLNGKRCDNGTVVEADDVEGYVATPARDSKGFLIVKNDELVIHKIFGNVEIRFRGEDGHQD